MNNDLNLKIGGGKPMWKVVAKSSDGCVIWTASPFDTEEEAEQYADRAVERGDDKTQWGEELTLWVERM